MKKKPHCRKRVKLVSLVIVLKFLKYFFMRDGIMSPKGLCGPIKMV